MGLSQLHRAKLSGMRSICFQPSTSGIPCADGYPVPYLSGQTVSSSCQNDVSESLLRSRRVQFARDPLARFRKVNCPLNGDWHLARRDRLTLGITRPPPEFAHRSSHLHPGRALWPMKSFVAVQICFGHIRFLWQFRKITWHAPCIKKRTREKRPDTLSTDMSARRGVGTNNRHSKVVLFL